MKYADIISYVHIGQVRSGRVGSGLGLVRSGQVSAGQVRPVQCRAGHGNVALMDTNILLIHLYDHTSIIALLDTNFSLSSYEIQYKKVKTTVV
jgi:hypothetical protein